MTRDPTLSDTPTTDPRYGRILLALGFLLIIVGGMRTITIPEFWTHLASAQAVAAEGLSAPDSLSFTTTDKTWVHTTWLYDKILLTTYTLGGAAAATLLHILLVVGTFALLVKTGRRRASGLAAGLTLLLAAWLILPRFEVQPRIAVLIFPAAFLYTLSRDPARGPTWLPFALLLPLQVLWCNMHGSFLLGPLLVLAFVLQEFLDARKAESDKNNASVGVIPLLGLTLGLLAVSLLNPAGTGLFAAALENWSNPTPLLGQTWISPFRADFGPAPSLLLLNVTLALGACALVLYKQRLPLALTLIAILVALFAIKQYASLRELFAVLSFPLICLGIHSIGAFARQRIKGNSAAQLPLLVTLGGGLAAAVSLIHISSNSYYIRLGSAASFGLGANTEMLPSAAMELIDHAAFPERFINLPLDGGYIAFRSQAGRKVFIDSRSALHGVGAYVDLYRALEFSHPNDEAGKAAFKRVFLAVNPQAFILNNTLHRADAMLFQLRFRMGWQVIYYDGSTTILAPLIKENQALFEAAACLHKKELETLDAAYTGYADQLGGYQAAPLPPRIIGASRVFTRAGLFGPARTAFNLLAAGVPDIDFATEQHGICELETGNFAAAIPLLQKAHAQQPENPLPLILLARAYEEAGMPAKAQETQQRGRQLLEALMKKQQAQIKAEEPLSPDPLPTPAP